MSGIDPFRAADVIIEVKGRREAFEYIFRRLKRSDDAGDVYSYHDWAGVLRAYAKLLVKRIRPTVH